MNSEIKPESKLKMKLNGTDCFIKVRWFNKTPVCVQFINKHGIVKIEAKKYRHNPELYGDGWSIWALPEQAAKIIFDGLEEVMGDVEANYY